MAVFDGKGKFITSWGAEYRGGAHGLHLAKEGQDEYLYLCDTKRSLVQKTDLNGKEVWRLGLPKGTDWLYEKPGQYKPTNVAIAPNGDIFIGDGYGKSYIHQYDKDAKLIRTFGGRGKDAGKLNCPHGLMVDTRGKDPVLVVADRGNRRLQLFDLQGNHLSFVTEEQRMPCHFDTFGEDLLVPDLESRVSIFDKNNKLIVHLGDGGHFRKIRTQPRDKFTPGKFIAPHSACYDHEGNIFVVEWVEVGRVTKLVKV